ncbi:MAG TPA: hypothetical protein VMB84_12625 [Stellaceae bacterium]|nr:hypothetical protein [Stellaceae bacterium]
MQNTSKKRLGRVAALAIASLGLIAVALPLHPAKADTMYLGWDFGNGFGVGIGTPPSAYGMHYCGIVATRGPCYNW